MRHTWSSLLLPRGRRPLLLLLLLGSWLKTLLLGIVLTRGRLRLGILLLIGCKRIEASLRHLPIGASRGISALLLLLLLRRLLCWLEWRHLAPKAASRLEGACKRVE